QPEPGSIHEQRISAVDGDRNLRRDRARAGHHELGRRWIECEVRRPGPGARAGVGTGVPGRPHLGRQDGERPAGPGASPWRASGVELPSWFVDRCRRAYLSVAFDAAAECRVLGVTSTAYGEGKTAVAIGIATAMAIDTKKPTLLVECDFAAPSLHKFLGLDQGRGLSEWL